MNGKGIFKIKGETVILNNIKQKDTIANLILGSSTVYPFIKIRQNGKYYMLDGILSCKNPIGELSDCSHVLSIHAIKTKVPQKENFFKISPFKKLKNSTMDYVGSKGYKMAYSQGYKEGDIHFERLKNTPFF